MRSGADLRSASPLFSFNHVTDPHFATFSSSLYTTIRNPKSNPNPNRNPTVITDPHIGHRDPQLVTVQDSLRSAFCRLRFLAPVCLLSRNSTGIHLDIAVDGVWCRQASRNQCATLSTRIASISVTCLLLLMLRRSSPWQLHRCPGKVISLMIQQI